MGAEADWGKSDFEAHLGFMRRSSGRRRRCRCTRAPSATIVSEACLRDDREGDAAWWRRSVG
jgi:hypothetical protein